MKSKSQELLNSLTDETSVLIQTHDFPDPDAVASAFGLQYFLKKNGIEASILYEGELQTNPIERMVKDLGIVMRNAEGADIKEEDQVIIIDGCKGNDNVASERGTVIGVIDHHLGTKPDDVDFLDIRSEYGASSTIMALYLQENGIVPTPDVATALAIGIHVDTGSLRRRVHQKDIEMLSFLQDKVDGSLLGSILRNNVCLEELAIYEKALANVRLSGHFAFYYYPGECAQNLLGILADFFLSVKEINFVVLCAQSNGKIIFSVRSENTDWNAAFIVRQALRGLGRGGGHRDMAGGAIKDPSLFDEKGIYDRFLKYIN